MSLRTEVAAAAVAPAPCQGICGRQVPGKDLREDGGFEVCRQCFASPKWTVELQRRRDAIEPPPSTNIVGRKTVQG